VSLRDAVRGRWGVGNVSEGKNPTKTVRSVCNIRDMRSNNSELDQLFERLDATE
jgi:hypothetical protein